MSQESFQALDSVFAEMLDNIRLPHSYYNKICTVRDEIIKIENDLKSKKDELRYSLDQLYIALGAEIRKNCPKLSVSINSNGCVVSFRSKSIICKALVADNKWSFGNDFGKIFTNRYPQCGSLDCDLAELANCINTLFAYQYRSLE
jgi:hypothetical protein